MGWETDATGWHRQTISPYHDGGYSQVTRPDGVTTSVTRRGITWTFQDPVQYGVYLNQDPWVKDNGDGIIITGISPNPTGTRNGFMVNPVAQYDQTYDDRIGEFESITSAKTLPYTAAAGESIISTISRTDESQYSQSWDESRTPRKISLSFAYLQSAVVLTCVSADPGSTAFRPPYSGTNKASYTTSDISTASLPDIAAPTGTPDMVYCKRAFERVWLQHLTDWQCRLMHPLENMANYHQYIGEDLSEMMGLLATDAWDNDLLYKFIQNGIDHYYCIISGNGDSATFEAHGVIAMKLLQETTKAANLWTGTADSLTDGRAEDKFYYWAGKQSTETSAIVTAGQVWTGYTPPVFFRKQTTQEHEHLYPSEWDQVGITPDYKNESYRHDQDSHPHMGGATLIRLMSLENHFSDNSLFDYQDRWYAEASSWSTLEPIIQTTYPSFDQNTPGFMGTTYTDEFLTTLYEGIP